MKILKMLPLGLLLLCCSVVLGQDVLDSYIQEGLKNNQQLIQEALTVETSKLALSQANGLLLPSASLEASYTIANGGRGIQFPVGDLLNPVYGTLNQLTDSDQFPSIENVNEQFLPDNFHETKLRIIQPLFNTDIYYSRAINRQLVNVAELKKLAYEKELIKEIKVAYFNYLQASDAIQIYHANESSLQELVRFNQKRFEQDLITKDEVYRAEFQLEQLIADRAESIALEVTARAYFNFLLNKPYDSPIERQEAFVSIMKESSEGVVETALQQRLELHQLDAAQEAQQLEYQMMNSRRFLPQINAVADLGYQGFGYDFNSDQDFWLVNFSLSWNLFSGFQKQHQSQISRVKLETLNSQEEQLKSRIALEVVKTQSEWEAYRNRYEAKSKALRSSKRNFEITESRYKENQALLIEYMDAQSSFISAQLDQTITKYQMLSKKAELERALAY